MKALLIDDEVISNYVASSMLIDNGLADEIQTVRDAREALDLLRLDQSSSTAFIPDFILLDINMPLMNGFEFVKALQNSSVPNHEPRIIIVSSSSHPSDTTRAKDLGIKHYLTKPLSLERLRSALEDMDSAEA